MTQRLLGLLVCLTSVCAISRGESDAPLPAAKQEELYIVWQIIDSTAQESIAGPSILKASNLRPGQGVGSVGTWGGPRGVWPFKSVQLSIGLGKGGAVEVYGSLRHDDGREEGCARILKLEKGSKCLFRLPGAGEPRFFFSVGITSPEPWVSSVPPSSTRVP